MNRIITLLVFFSLALISYGVIKYSMEYPELMPIEESAAEGAELGTYQDWIEYTAPNGRFSASFPVMPQTATKNYTDPDTGEKREYDMYVSEKSDQTILLITLITFPEMDPGKTAEETLQAVPNDILSKHPGSRSDEMEAGTYEGFPSLTFTISGAEFIYNAKTFMDGKTLFILARISKPAHKDNNEFQQFIESFQLTREGVSQ